jgi:hypothetical protein
VEYTAVISFAHITHFEIPSGFLLFIAGALTGILASWTAREFARRAAKRD